MEHVIGHDGLLGTKARILVTHSISAIREFDTVAYLRRGVLLECGTPSELLSRADGELAKLVRGHTHTPSRRSSGSTTPVGDGDAATLAISESSLPDRTSGQFDELVKVKLPMDRRKSFGMAALANTLPIRAPAELSKEHKEQGILLL
jgi:ATP-binding cassette, subfamily C (CFTR/MRP), member 1